MKVNKTAKTEVCIQNHVFMFLLKASLCDYVMTAYADTVEYISRMLYLHVNIILLLYGRTRGHCFLVGILYSNQSTAHCLHRQLEDYCRRCLGQYSLLRLKSYFSASTG